MRAIERSMHHHNSTAARLGSAATPCDLSTSPKEFSLHDRVCPAHGYVCTGKSRAERMLHRLLAVPVTSSRGVDPDLMKKIVSVVERMLGGESGWKWS